MFLGRKNQYYENDYITKRNLQIHCDPYQITNGIFYRTGTKKYKICMEKQMTQIVKKKLKKKNKVGGITLLDFDHSTKLQ